MDGAGPTRSFERAVQLGLPLWLNGLDGFIRELEEAAPAAARARAELAVAAARALETDRAHAVSSRRSGWRGRARRRTRIARSTSC